MRILAFGATKEIVGGPEFELETGNLLTVADLKSELFNRFPKLNELKSLTIAVNEQYVPDETRLDPKDVIALIPPVSGG